MNHKVVTLAQNARLHIYVSDIRINPTPRTGPLVIPGGGYRFVAKDREGEPIALAFCGMGLNCFVLEYGVGQDACFPGPLREAALAMEHIKANAVQYDIDPQRVFVIGFSAGGHLAGSLGSFWYREDLTGVPPKMAKPAGAALIYPVITGGACGNRCRSSRNPELHHTWPLTSLKNPTST